MTRTPPPPLLELNPLMLSEPLPEDDEPHVDPVSVQIFTGRAPR